MPRTRIPTAVHMLRHGFREHKARREARKYEPKDCNPLGPCPERLSPEAREAWNDIASRAYWLKEPDEIVLERAAILLAEARTKPFDANVERLLQNWIKMLGLPATERSKVQVLPTEPTNPFAKTA